MTEVLKTAFTTPEAPELQALLAFMVERGVTDVAMEVSGRCPRARPRATGNTWFAAAGFTNLSEDHLDFHPTMEEYWSVKSRLFSGEFTHRPVVVIDDRWGRQLADKIGSPDVVGVGTTMRSHWSALDIATQPDGSTRFRVERTTDVRGRPDEHDGLITRSTCGMRYPGCLQRCGMPCWRWRCSTRTVIEPVARRGRNLHGDGAGTDGTGERSDQDFLAVVDYSHKPAGGRGRAYRAAPAHSLPG